MPVEEAGRQEDPVESGALEDEGAEGQRPPQQQDPVESGALEEEPEQA